MPVSPRIIPVKNADEDLRFDQFLAEHFSEYSRSQLAAAIRSGAALVEGRSRKSSYRLKTGEQVSFVGCIETVAQSSLAPEKIDFPILFEDNHLLVLVKPPALVVHPGSGNHQGTLANGLLYYCKELAEIGGDMLRPGIVHRLDKDTSGVMVVAKTERSHRLLVEMFAGRQLKKEYLALVCGVPREEQGEVIAPIGRHPVQRQKMAVTEGGRYAVSRWRVVRRFSRHTLLRVNIETGRTHQIRVHLASCGLPVAGDRLYGGSRARSEQDLFPRQMLHAHRLCFFHPITKEPLNMVAALWPDMAHALATLVEVQ